MTPERDPVVPHRRDPRYAGNEEEEPEHGAARQEPEELGNRTTAAQDPPVREHQVHRAVERGPGRGKVVLMVYAPLALRFCA